MWQSRQRRRHVAGEDRTDPDTVMEPLVKVMETVRISLWGGGKQEEEHESNLEIAVGKKPGERGSEANATMGG